jgi:hypothetical protein
MPDEFRHLGEEKTQDVLVRILENNKNELNNLYESYTKPLTNSEKIKVNLSMIDGILHRDGGTRKDTTILINAIREAITTSKYKRKFLKDVIIPNWLNENSFSKTLLDKDISTEEKQAKFELIMNFFTRDLVYGGLLPLVGKDIMDKYYNDLSPALQKKISEIENVLGPSEMMLYKDFNFGKLEHK